MQSKNQNPHNPGRSHFPIKIQLVDMMLWEIHRERVRMFLGNFMKPRRVSESIYNLLRYKTIHLKTNLTKFKDLQKQGRRFGLEVEMS